MSEDETTSFLDAQTKLHLGTINPDGTPHMVTMFHAVVDGRLAFWTYRASQKARNIARDPRVTCLVEAGEDYFELVGALVYGRAETLTEPNDVRYVGRQVVRRMLGPDHESAVEPFVDATAAKRYAYLVTPDRVVSWDHRKLTGN
ncbi:PPOX class probable F420-dependent enzyme [Thermomonospora echinospora]|uniref:PPOX class probable F420-dependent enzyme n=1 Tax=Thermomonospora echinospora TaxID=1992 RepID=A0A1H5V3S3_9ACTN|nr:pyridoxamine 5'-phosphate oxidase family protein [Thermomonospora echinospora]SEF81883.1 PPOX class probable F420-dependent enzyme [Thermomonospora echinospora]